MSDLPPANWYPDPEVPGQLRYWDGTQWTEHRAPATGAQAQPGAESGTPSGTEAGDQAWTSGAPKQPQWSQHAAGGQQPQWGQQPSYGETYAQPARGSTNGMAIASLVVAILSFFLAFIVIGAIGGIVAVVLGFIALRQIRDAGGNVGGRGLAISGIIVGAISIVLGIIMFAVFAFLGTAFEQGSTGFVDVFECLEEEARTGQDLDC